VVILIIIAVTAILSTVVSLWLALFVKSICCCCCCCCWCCCCYCTFGCLML